MNQTDLVDVSAVRFGCGVFALAIPLLLIAGFYSQLLLDRLGEARDHLVLAVVVVVAVVGEIAALVGVVRPSRPLETVAALGTALSGTGVVLVVVYLMRLRARRGRNR